MIRDKNLSQALQKQIIFHCLADKYITYECVVFVKRRNNYNEGCVMTYCGIKIMTLKN